MTALRSVLAQLPEIMARARAAEPSQCRSDAYEMGVALEEAKALYEEIKACAIDDGQQHRCGRLEDHVVGEGGKVYVSDDKDRYPCGCPMYVKELVRRGMLGR